MSKSKQIRIDKWDICSDFHGMNDFGFAGKEVREKTGQLYGKTRTYSGECYAIQNGRKCTRKGVCVKAIIKRSIV